MNRPLHDVPNLVILSGAGLSAESGVKTFRDSGGLWEGHRVEDVASPEGFARQPDVVHHFYNLRRAQMNEVAPNAAHLALARLEQGWRGNFLHITQNVDDLSERAGAKRLRHMHGELLKARCTACDRIFPWLTDLTPHTACPACGTRGEMRPHIVWFGEMPFYMDELMETVAEADIFISIGTSGVVYPAAGFAQMARKHGASLLIEVNQDDTGISSQFHEHRIGPATVEVPKLVEELLATYSATQPLPHAH